MNKFLLGAIGLGLLIAGVVIGYAVPKSSVAGAVNYAKEFFYDVDISNALTVKTLTTSGATTLGAVTASAITATSITTGATTSTFGVTINSSPLYIKTSSTYCTKIVPSTTAAALVISTTTSCQ